MKYFIFGSLLFLLLVLIYLYFRRNKFTRERYAFWASLSLFSFGGMVLVHIFTDNSLIKIVVELLNISLDSKIPIPQTSWSDKLWSVIIFSILATVVLSIYKNWDGAKSEEEANWSSRPFIKNALMGIPTRKIVISIEDKEKEKPFEQPYFDSSLAWHSNVVKMLKIISKQYYVDVENDWYSEKKLFISKFSQKNIVIFCTLEEPSKDEIQEKIEFSRQHIEGELFKFIVAVQNENKVKVIETFLNTTLEYRYKEELLNSLVDFSDYFDYIKRAYEDKEISDGDGLRLQDIYVESEGEIPTEDTKAKPIKSIEQYILKWTKENSNKHISLLGEYGQGKSVLSLKVAYEMIQNNHDRIPIIIELRGKSPRNESLESIVASWASTFGIQALGMIRLLEEGKLLIILEGFDEMDMIGDSQRRWEHFNRLWEFARYEKSKVLITGRPNLFLDNEEMVDYLNAFDNRSNLFYSEAIHIKPFNEEQIADALRNVELSVRSEILELLKEKTNDSFEDLISRPSTLYQASIIWSELDKENINSASVIEHFLNHAYKRQSEKLRSIGRTGVETLLTNNERKYFMLGIAVGMVQKNGYTNQINRSELEKIVQKLYEFIPDEVSSDYKINKPLKQRMKDNKEALESIFNDIRTSAILVRDLTQNDSFKFAHKSFVEYLNAKYFVEFRYRENKATYLDKIYKVYMEGIEKSFNNKGVTDFSNETAGFIVDMLNLNDIDSNKSEYCLDVLKFISSKTIIYNQIFFSKIWSKIFRVIFTGLVFSFIHLVIYFSDKSKGLEEESSFLLMIVILGIYVFGIQFFWSKVKHDLFLYNKNYIRLFSRICDSNLKVSINKLEVLEFYKNIESQDLKKLSFFDRVTYNKRKSFLDKFFEEIIKKIVKI
ncbi:MAG: Unknown protein [uncultured Sulfurovum sp.]|uniref:NACHT domain-containing protein n=1 Tax=uncultured Sulfurovum sp. TaxID=269237 RepID=A0A6S6RV01_9BACT|nr:MAG: Unknown protein [uncultured Sulfurovum sp.]